MLNCKGMMTRKLCIHFLSRKNFKSIDIPVPNCYSCARISARSVSANQSKHSEKGTSQFKDLHEIPGPFRLPLLGTSWMYWKLGPYSRHTFHQADIDLHKKYGSIYLEVRGGVPLVSIHRASDIEKVFRQEGPQPLRVINEALVYRRKKFPQIFPTVGLSESTGEEWQTLRKKVSPSLLRPKEAGDAIPRINEVGDDLILRLKDVVAKEGSMVHDFGKWTVRYGGEAIWRSALNLDFGSLGACPSPEANRLSELALQTFQIMAQIRLGSNKWRRWPELFPKYRKFAAVDDAVHKFASKHILDAFDKIDKGEESLQDTILGKFSRVRDLDRRDAVTVIVDMFSAGVTTTATALLLILHRLGQEPEVVRRLQEELRTVLASPNSPVTLETIKEMSYLRAVVAESYRLTPIIPSLIRILPKDIVIDGYRIPAHTPIIAKTRAACLNSDNFSKPLEFLPQRWLPDELIADEEGCRLKAEAKLQRFLVKPFGYGARTCVGMRLAETELYVALAKILRQFEVKSEGEVKLGNFLFLAPLHPVPLTLIPNK